MGNPRREEFSFLRSRYFDGADNFMKGCKIVRRRDPSAAKRKHPHWVFRDEAVLQVLRRRFPLLEFPGRDQHQAARWFIVIKEHWQFRIEGMKIEMQHGWTPGTVASIAQQIRWADAGLRLDGTKPTGRRRGRPKKQKTQELNAETENVHSLLATSGRIEAQPVPSVASTT
jgi:hypothetical protein